MNFAPTANHIVVRLNKTNAVTKSGIHIPSTAQNDEPSIAIVEAIGPDVKSVKLNDKIVYRMAKHTVVRDPQENTYIFMEDKDILALVND